MYLLYVFNSLTFLRPYFGLSHFWALISDRWSFLRSHVRQSHFFEVLCWTLDFVEILFLTVRFFWGLILITWTFLRSYFNENNRSKMAWLAAFMIVAEVFFLCESVHQRKFCGGWLQFNGLQVCSCNKLDLQYSIVLQYREVPNFRSNHSIRDMKPSKRAIGKEHVETRT